LQHANFPHQRLGNGEGARDHGQLGVEHTGKGEQVVSLVLQGDAHGADPSFVRGLAGGEFGDEEVEQLAPGCQVWAGQSQNVVAQPVQERADVTGEPVCLGFGLSRPVQLGGKVAVRDTLTGAADPGLQRLALRRRTLGEGELWRKLGDGGVSKAAYRGG
jgi:hypothetical protein